MSKVNLNDVTDEKKNEDQKQTVDLNHYMNQEVIVHKRDLRKPIYNSRLKKSPIIKCIGQLNIVYKYVNRGPYIIQTQGTGTVFSVDSQNVAHVLTCAHNVCRYVYECNKCKGYMEMRQKNVNNDKMEEVRKCIYCQHTDLNTTFIKASEIEFNRRCIAKELIIKSNDNDNQEKVFRFGDLIEGYECNVKSMYVPSEYQNYPYPTSGYDYAILSFKDTNNYYSEYCKNIILSTARETLHKDTKFSIAGYPGDKPDQLWGMHCLWELFK